MHEQKIDKTSSWQASLIHAITDPEELLQLLELNQTNWILAAKKAALLFPLKVPREFVSRMQKGNIDDPLLKQVLPLNAEFLTKSGFEKDPLNEKQFNPIPGLLHKYHGRVLLTMTGACGINCRFCFRRHFPYHENNPGKNGWNHVLQYIAEDPTIKEVILSGGDPLVLSDHLLSEFAFKLADIPHLKRLRIHSRMPIMMPERITNEFQRWTENLPLKMILVLHCNHPQEINNKVKEALSLLKKITLLNQSVLLKDINDRIDILISLSETLFEAGVMPYYLNLLDKVEGTAHFDVDINKAKELHAEMIKNLPGYLVPKLVREQPGEPSKLTVQP